MDAARRLVERVVRATYPFLTYLPQYYLLQKTSKDGFAPATCLAELLARTLAVGAWANRSGPHNASAPVGGVLGVFAQLLLLDAVVQARRKKSGRGITQPTHRPRYGATTRQLGREVRAVFRAAVRDRDKALALERFKKLRVAFWAWDELGPYVEVLVVFSLYLVGASFLLGTFRWFGSLLMTAAAVMDAISPAPQLIRTFRRRDAAGVSALTVGLRFIGGVFGFAYGARPKLSAARAFLDALVVALVAWHSPPVARVRAACALLLDPVYGLVRRGCLWAHRRRAYARVPTEGEAPASPKTPGGLEEGASPRRESPAKEAVVSGE